MENILIKKFTKQDISDAANIFKNAFKLEGEDWSFENARKHILEVLETNGCHLVSTVNNKITGFLLSSETTKVEGTELYVDTFAVDPMYQNLGIGKLLIEQAFSYAKLNKLVALCLMTNPTMKSYNWYMKIGMKESGWIEVYKRI